MLQSYNNFENCCLPNCDQMQTLYYGLGLKSVDLVSFPWFPSTVEKNSRLG